MRYKSIIGSNDPGPPARQEPNDRAWLFVWFGMLAVAALAFAMHWGS